MIEPYTTILIADEKNRITIPVRVREKIDPDNFQSKLVFRLSYDVFTNEITLIPLGETTTK